MPAVKPAPQTSRNFLLLKLTLLAGALILLLLSLVVLPFAGLTFTYFLDVGQLVSAESLYSLPLIVFALLTAIAFSLTAFYGLELETVYSLIPLFLFLVAAFASVLVVPAYFPIFLALAIGLGVAPILASISKDKPSYALASKSIRMALFIFLIGVTIFSGIKTELNKDAYFDKFLIGTVNVGLTPVVQQGGETGQVAQQVSETLTPEFVRTQLANNALFKTFYNYFSIMIAGIVFLTASAFTFVVRWLTKPISYFLAKTLHYEAEFKWF